MLTQNYIKYKYYLDSRIEQNILYEKEEICANAVLDENANGNTNVLKLINVQYGETVNGRESCSVKVYSPIIFHTHPRSSWNPPSVEDINKVFKNKNIRTSIIVSSWGLFEIIKTRNINEKVLPDKVLNEIKNIIDTININTFSVEYEDFKSTLKSILYNTDSNLKKHTEKMLRSDFRGPKNTDWELLSIESKNLVINRLEFINMHLRNYYIYIKFTSINFRPINFPINREYFIDYFYY